MSEERKQARFHYTADRQLIRLEGDIIPPDIGTWGFSTGYYITLFYDVDLSDHEKDEIMAQCYERAAQS